MFSKHRHWTTLAICLLMLGCAAVTRPLMPTPNIYIDPEREIFEDLSPPLKSTEVELLYVTDRAPEKDASGNLRYGFERSGSIALGEAVVDLGVDITWEELLQASRTQGRIAPLTLDLRSVDELVRLPPTPVPFGLVDGAIVEDTGITAEREQAVAEFRRTLNERLAQTPQKDVFIFVHGYHNTFDDAAFALAELWHFLGRIGVPIVYTWPAGFPGIFGYTYDRESSEYTVYHLKQLLRMVSSFPEVERVHLIAHSRGTDVSVAALRELTIWARAAGIDPKERLKIHNWVLAAPDLDLEVVEQRVVAEKLGLSVGRATLYTSPNDKAIGFAEKLFASPRGRLGTLGLSDLTEVDVAVLKKNPSNIAIINFTGSKSDKADKYGHSYFRTNPAVSSDLILMLRYDLEPGPPGRPLENLGLSFWRIPTGYPDHAPGE